MFLFALFLIVLAIIAPQAAAGILKLAVGVLLLGTVLLFF